VPGHGATTPWPATPGPAAPGPAGRAGHQARRQPALAPVEVDRIVDKVQRKLLHRLAVEAERRGTPR
jgi:hypothetical protein